MLDYPPITNLISATFDGMKNHVPTGAERLSVKSPEPVANAAGMGEGNDKLGMNSAALSATNRVGTVLNTVA